MKNFLQKIATKTATRSAWIVLAAVFILSLPPIADPLIDNIIQRQDNLLLLGSLIIAVCFFILSFNFFRKKKWKFFDESAYFLGSSFAIIFGLILIFAMDSPINFPEILEMTPFLISLGTATFFAEGLKEILPYGHHTAFEMGIYASFAIIYPAFWGLGFSFVWKKVLKK